MWISIDECGEHDDGLCEFLDFDGFGNILFVIDELAYIFYFVCYVFYAT